jgi:hypothetical protein
MTTCSKDKNSLPNGTDKNRGTMAVAQCLPRMYEAWGLIPNIRRKKK